MPGFLGDEDPDPVHKEDVAIGCLKGLQFPIHLSYLLCWVGLMQIPKLISIADCCKDGLVIIITFSNIN